MSQHAQRRSQQRAVRHEAIEAALDFGVEARGRRGAIVYRLDDRALQLVKDKRGVERLRGVTVVEVDGVVVTVWKNARLRMRGGWNKRAWRRREDGRKRVG